MATIPELMAEKKMLLEEEARHKAEQDEIEKEK